MKRQLLRWSGITAMIAGLIFAAIQPIHPPDVLASVTTSAWAIIMPLKLIMCLFFLSGIVGIYARQVDESGWLGLVGFALFSISWWLQAAFVFIETFLLPVLAEPVPQLVTSLLGVVNSTPGSMNLGALPAVYAVVSVCYLLGCLLVGIATLRAGILPRWPAALLAGAGPLAMIMVALLPHQLERLAAMPMGFAVIWLGYAVWAEQPARTAQPIAGTNKPHPAQHSLG